MTAAPVPAYPRRVAAPGSWAEFPPPCTLPTFRYPSLHHGPFKVLSLTPAFGMPRFTPKAVQVLLGHSEVKTTLVYTHVLNRGGKGVHSPADRLGFGLESL